MLRSISHIADNVKELKTLSIEQRTITTSLLPAAAGLAARRRYVVTQHVTPSILLNHRRQTHHQPRAVCRQIIVQSYCVSAYSAQSASAEIWLRKKTYPGTPRISHTHIYCKLWQYQGLHDFLVLWSIRHCGNILNQFQPVF